MQIPDVGNAAAVFVLERVRTFVLCTVLWQVVDAGRILRNRWMRLPCPLEAARIELS